MYLGRGFRSFIIIKQHFTFILYAEICLLSAVTRHDDGERIRFFNLTFHTLEVGLVHVRVAFKCFQLRVKIEHS